MVKRIVSVGLCLLAIVFAAVGVFAYPYLYSKQEQKTEKMVLSLWHVDGFEGGKGSRLAFLTRAARAFEKQNGNVYVMVDGYTGEGLSFALKEGKRPDLVSFSGGVDGVAEIAKALPYSFIGGEIEGKCYAYPWAVGSYFLFSLQDDFSNAQAENTLLSLGGNNVPQAAAVLSGIVGKAQSKNSTAAYVDFLNGKVPYLLGTQRDVCRFSSRGVDVKSKPLQEYCDLFQCISVTATGQKEEKAARSFVDYLLSPKAQEKLAEIGMYPYETGKNKYVLSVFSDQNGVKRTKAEAEKAMQNGDIKILKSYLKTLN